MEDLKQEIPDYIPPGEPGRWYHNGWFSRGFLLVASLFFFLPFINIKCSGVHLASIHGTDLITGAEIKKNNPDTATADISGSLASAGLFAPPVAAPEAGDQKKIEPNVMAIVSMASIILGLVFSFFTKRVPMIISGGFGLLGGLSLFLLQIVISQQVQEKLGPFNFVPITFDFSPYYWSCLFLQVLASVFAFVRSSVLVR